MILMTRPPRGGGAFFSGLLLPLKNRRGQSLQQHQQQRERWLFCGILFPGRTVSSSSSCVTFLGPDASTLPTANVRRYCNCWDQCHHLRPAAGSASASSSATATATANPVTTRWMSSSSSSSSAILVETISRPTMPLLEHDDPQPQYPQVDLPTATILDNIVVNTKLNSTTDEPGPAAATSEAALSSVSNNSNTRENTTIEKGRETVQDTKTESLSDEHPQHQQNDAAARTIRARENEQWWETARSLLSTPEFELFLQQKNSDVAILQPPLDVLMKLCQDRPMLGQTAQLVHCFLEQMHQLLRKQQQIDGRSHLDTTNHSGIKNSNALHLASAVHQTMRAMLDRNHWRPNTTSSFQTLIRMAALIRDPHAAEAWLELQWKASRRRQQQRNLVEAPNRQDYTAVVQAWARSSSQYPYMVAADRAALLVRQLQHHYAQGKEPTLQPTEAAYTGWIVALTTPPTNNSRHHPKQKQRSRQYDRRVAASAAEQVLQEMWDRVELDHFVPSATIYNAVLSAWAIAGHPDRAEAILRDQCQKAQLYDYCRPDATSFASVIAAYATVASDRSDAPERAEALLELQCRYAAMLLDENSDNNNGNSSTTEQQHEARPRVQPNVVTYSSLLNCWAKSNHPDAPLRAEAILQHMQQQSKETDNPAIRPNTLSYNSVLNAWARSGRVEAAEQVERLWREMQAQSVPPDRVTYMSRINAWERHRGRHLPRTAARQAARVLDEMMHGSSANNGGTVAVVQPTTLHFNRVILAWTQCGDALQAEALLEVMLGHFFQGRTESAPNLSSFNFVLSAWSKQSSRAAAAQAEAWLDRMEEYSSSLGLTACQPDVVSYNTVLASWARSGADDVAWERATALKRRMEGQLDNLQPDIYTYGSLLQIVAKSTQQTPRERAANANKLLIEMQDSGVQPNSFILRLADQCTARREG